MAKRKIERSDEGFRFAERFQFIAILTFLALLFLSLRILPGIFIGSIFSVAAFALAFYNYRTLRNRYLKLRAKYTMLAVFLALIGYYCLYGIANGDIVQLTNLSVALVTATSISAVFAVNMYEKISNITIRHKKELSKELLDINIRLAVYPILISVGAVFASILALVFARSNFGFSIFLVNVTITAVLLTLIASVALLKEGSDKKAYLIMFMVLIWLD